MCNGGITLRSWKLFSNSSLLANLENIGVDQPWFTCKFIPHPEFENHRDFFLEFAAEYESGEVRNYDEFFSMLKNKGYSLHEGERISERFTILFEQDSNKVRLRRSFSADI